MSEERRERQIAQAALAWEIAVEDVYRAEDARTWQNAMRRRYAAAENLAVLVRKYGHLGARHPLRESTEQARAAHGGEITFAEGAA